MSTRLRALGVVAATVLLTGGCAAGTHPGAAAVVGETEISISDVDQTSRAVTTALGQTYPSTAALSDMVNNVLADQVGQRKSITVTPAETADAARQAAPEGTYEKFQADPLARDFLNGIAKSLVVTIKLGGGTVKDLGDRTKMQEGVLALREDAKGLDITVAPRFGKWTDGQIDSKISGSLSDESPQTEAQRKAAENAQQQGQG
ncbi:hypothetical protein [Kribbella sp. HUAS MG21]|uniref:Lipoprotein n=1 Tax=Kribbella sp. HUAS MG21 TaxID=3160966 RepID=A0AAU7TP94_9ACTN